MPTEYSPAQKAIHNQNLMTYQVNHADGGPNDNLYIKPDGSYNVTKNRKTVRRGEVSDIEEFAKWLDLIVSMEYPVDYTITINTPHKILRFMDVDGIIWSLPFDNNLPAELYPLEEYLDSLMADVTIM